LTGAANPTDKCLLHIPHKEVGGLEDVITPSNIVHKRKLEGLLSAFDDNFQSIEQWVDRFYKECICDCAGGGT
jgi:hypothetical protein